MKAATLPSLPPRLLTPALLACVILLAACGKKETPKTTVAPVSPKSVAVSEATLDAEITQALTPTKNEREAGLEAQAEDVLDKYPNKNATELLNQRARRSSRSATAPAAIRSGKLMGGALRRTESADCAGSSPVGPDVRRETSHERPDSQRSTSSAR